MKRVILKSALVTVGALTAIGILIFSLWILISPQSMATVSEKIGNYSFAVTCADLAASQYREGDLLKAVETCSKGEYQCYNRLVIAVAESRSAEDLETLKSAPSDLGAKEYVNGLIALFVK